MKCPKCGYLGFDDGDRCRNCGYDFSLMDHDRPDVSPPPARPRATPLNVPPTPRADRLRPRAGRSSRDLHTSTAGAGLDRPLARTPEIGAIDLPLFEAEFPEGAALPPPHRPLAVRRATPAPSRPRPRPAAPEPVALALDLDDAPPRPTPDAGEIVPDVARPARAETPASRQAAGLARRAAAAMVDVALVLVVDLVTIYFTLGLCGLDPGEWDILPVVPLAMFFLMLNGGYLILLTGTLGQTLGKMAVQIEVVADGRPTVGLSRATCRVLASFLSALPAGLGFVWALRGDHRAWHDRLTGTRVVHATMV